jgi:hypothetical protein
MGGFCATCLAETWDFDPGPLPLTSHLEWSRTGRCCGDCGSEIWVLKHLYWGLPLPGGDQYRVIHQADGDLLVRAVLPPGYHETAVSRCPRCHREMFNAMVRQCPDCHVPLTALSPQF